MAVSRISNTGTLRHPGRPSAASLSLLLKILSLPLNTSICFSISIIVLFFICVGLGVLFLCLLFFALFPAQVFIFFVLLCLLLHGPLSSDRHAEPYAFLHLSVLCLFFFALFHSHYLSFSYFPFPSLFPPTRPPPLYDPQGARCGAECGISRGREGESGEGNQIKRGW